jgi:hypothetical protein
MLRRRGSESDNASDVEIPGNAINGPCGEITKRFDAGVGGQPVTDASMGLSSGAQKRGKKSLSSTCNPSTGLQRSTGSSDLKMLVAGLVCFQSLHSVIG